MSTSENCSDAEDINSENERLSNDDDSEMDYDDAGPFKCNDSKSPAGAEKTSERREKKKALTYEKLASIHQEEVCQWKIGYAVYIANLETNKIVLKIIKWISMSV